MTNDQNQRHRLEYEMRSKPRRLSVRIWLSVLLLGSAIMVTGLILFSRYQQEITRARAAAAGQAAAQRLATIRKAIEVYQRTAATKPASIPSTAHE